MSRYLRYFPTVKYGDKVLVDLTKRIRFNETLGSNPFVFLPYTIKEGERPEDLSNLYYGTVDDVWLIYLANNIVDPFYDWPMTHENLEGHVATKYSDKGATSRLVIQWAQDTTISDNIINYTNVLGDTISPSSYDLATTLDDTFVAGEWSATRVYDYEFQRNEDCRQIRVVDRKFRDQITSEMQEALST